MMETFKLVEIVEFTTALLGMLIWLKMSIKETKWYEKKHFIKNRRIN